MLFGKKKKQSGPTRLLLADDDKDLVATVSMVLKRKGYEMITASDGQECVMKAQSEQPDLILLDYAMPKMDGTAALVKLKAIKETQNIPVIMLTGHDEKEKMASAQKSGAVDYVVKPCEYPVLLGKIADALKSRK